MRANSTSPHRARRNARELLVKALYQWQLAGHGEAELCRQFADMPEYAAVDQKYFREILAVVLRDAESLDLQIAARADRNIRRLDAVTRAVLWLGVAELHHRGDVPTRVVINEAVELAKRYGPTDCFRFVNAVLDRAAEHRETPRDTSTESRGA